MKFEIYISMVKEIFNRNGCSNEGFYCANYDLIKDCYENGINPNICAKKCLEYKEVCDEKTI